MKTLNELIEKIHVYFTTPDLQPIKSKDYMGREVIIEPKYLIRVMNHKQYFALVDRHRMEYFIFDDSNFSLIKTNKLDRKGEMRLTKQAFNEFVKNRDVLSALETCGLDINYPFIMAMNHRFYYHYWNTGDKKIFIEKLFIFMGDKEAQDKTKAFYKAINLPLLYRIAPDLSKSHRIMQELRLKTVQCGLKINKEFANTLDKLMKLNRDFKPYGYGTRTILAVKNYQDLIKKIKNKNEFNEFIFCKNLTAYNIIEFISIFSDLVSYGYSSEGIIRYVTKLRFTNGIKDAKTASTLLRDYARMQIEMNNKEFKKYPKWLKPAHDLTTNIYNIRSYHEQYDAKIAERAEILVNKYSFYDKFFMITAPADHKEIVEDATVLDHCGSSYIEEHANGNTTILFVRRNGKEEIPLCTLEINDQTNDILQAVCSSNTSPKGELSEFIDKFKKHIKR
ncbi:MAG: PcfJ domain-containing protein [Aeromonas jandaei]